MVLASCGRCAFAAYADRISDIELLVNVTSSPLRTRMTATSQSHRTARSLHFCMTVVLSFLKEACGSTACATWVGACLCAQRLKKRVLCIFTILFSGVLSSFMALRPSTTQIATVSLLFHPLHLQQLDSERATILLEKTQARRHSRIVFTLKTSGVSSQAWIHRGEAE